jgi:hypothetical protein
MHRGHQKPLREEKEDKVIETREGKAAKNSINCRRDPTKKLLSQHQ